MADILVIDWIEEFEALTESEIHTYAADQEHNHEIILALHVVFEEPQLNKKPDLIDRVCQQLFAFYRSGEIALKRFAMQYIPNLVLLHLTEKTGFPSVETLIVSLYNLEVVDNKMQPRVKSFRVPSIAQSSMYHDSSNLEPAFIAQSSLRRLEECNTKLVNWGPLPQVEALNAQNRQRVVTALVFLFNEQIASAHSQALEHVCRVISRLVSQGFQIGGYARTSVDSDSYQNSLLPRLVVSSPLLLEFVHAVYHALERGVSGAAQTLHDITQRATYETYADVLLVAHAISNLLHRTPEANMPARSAKQQITKSMITNASFRTKKLPDDIPIQDQEEGAGDASLGSIIEEGGSDLSDKKGFRGRSGSALKHLPKLPGLGKKPKLKSSPTPPRHSLEDTPPGLDLRMSTGSSGGGDQVSLVASNSNGSMQSEISHNTVHVSTV